VANNQLIPSLSLSAPLPPDQWIQEVRNLFNVSLAVLQFGTFVAAPPQLQITPNSTYDMYIVPPNTTEEKNLCRNQKVRTSTHYSFNLFGLLIILILGFILIVLSNTVPSIVFRLQRNKTKSSVKLRREEWEKNDVLSVFSYALEKSGIGPWMTGGRHTEVPVLSEANLRFTLPWLSDSNNEKHYAEDISEDSVSGSEENQLRQESNTTLLPDNTTTLLPDDARDSESLHLEV
jgi:hypothetical protein